MKPRRTGVKRQDWALNYNRQKAIEKLGGVKCSGLSFINGPDCPVSPEFLKDYDINFSHRKPSGARRGKGPHENKERAEYKILRMKNPEKIFILLCCLCNQRMRHIMKEYGYLYLPKRVIKLYVDKRWTLEEIAEEYDCGYDTVSDFLKRNAIKVRPGNCAAGEAVWARPSSRKRLLKERRTRWLSDDRIKRAKEMSRMYNEGDSIREVAQSFGTTKGSVMSHLRLIGKY